MSHVQITHLSVRSSNGQAPAGFKRQTFDHDLTGFDVFVGTNGAGKTSRLLAIVACLEGLAGVPTDPRRPYLGGLPANTAVELTTTGGEVYRDLSASRGKLVTEADEAARKIVGRTSTAWDLSDFASGTDGDRGRILDLAAKAGGVIAAWTVTDAHDHVRDILVPRDPEQQAQDRSHGQLDACIKALPSADSAASWLTNALAWADKKQTDTNADQKATRNFSNELGQVKPERVETPAEQDAARRSELLSTLADLKRGEADVVKAQQALDRHVAEGQRLDAQLAATLAEGQRLGIATPAPVGGYDATADTARKTELAAELVTAKAALEVARKAAADANDKAIAADIAYRAVDARRSAARDEASKAAANLATFRSLSADQNACCKDCGVTDPLDIGGKVAAAESAQVAAEAALVDLDRERNASSSVVDAAKAWSMGARDAVAVAERKVADTERDIAAAVATIERETKRAATATADHAKADARREQDLTAARQRYAATATAVKGWRALVAPTLPEPLDPAKVAQVEAELADIAARDRLRNVAENHVKNLRAAIAKADTAEATWKEVRALVDALKQTRDDLASAAYGPIEAAARTLLDGIPGLPTPFFAGPNDYGATIEGRGRVQFAGLSESESRITGACFVYALAVISAQPCRLVLLDGLDVVQRDHRAPLLSAFARAKAAGWVDNIIVTCQVSADPTIAAGELAELGVDGATLHRVEFQPVGELPAAVASTASPSTSDAVDLDGVPF